MGYRCKIRLKNPQGNNNPGNSIPGRELVVCVVVRAPECPGPMPGGVPDSPTGEHRETGPTAEGDPGPPRPERGSTGRPETAGAGLHDPRQWRGDLCGHRDPCLPEISHPGNTRGRQGGIPSNTEVRNCNSLFSNFLFFSFIFIEVLNSTITCTFYHIHLIIINYS